MTFLIVLFTATLDCETMKEFLPNKATAIVTFASSVVYQPTGQPSTATYATYELFGPRSASSNASGYLGTASSVFLKWQLISTTSLSFFGDLVQSLALVASNKVFDIRTGFIFLNTNSGYEDLSFSMPFG